jgi:PRTRC genetic system protein A
MHFRNPKQQSLFQDQNYETEESEVKEIKIPQKKAEVPVISFDDQFTFWNHLTDVQYGEFKPDNLTKANTWVITRNGTWLVQKNKSGYYAAKKNDYGIPTLPITKPLPEAFFDLTYGKIPYSILQQIVAFFRGIMEKHNDAEAFIQIYWDLQDHKYVCHVPKQQVSKGSVQYDAEENLSITDKNRYIFVYECHSHNSMGAFWSGTDNADEKELRVYGVFGNLDNEEYKCLHRFFVGEKQVNVDVSLVFDIPKKEENTKYVVSHKNKQYLVKKDQLILDEKPKYIYHTEAGEKVYIPVENVVAYKESPEKVDFPADWFESVNVPLPTRTKEYGGRIPGTSVWKNDFNGKNWDGGSGYWPNYSDSRKDALDFQKEYSRTKLDTEDIENAEYEMMVEDVNSMTAELLHFTSDFEDLEPTFVFLETVEQNMALKSLEKAIQNYYYRSRQLYDEGPSDGKY